MAVVPGRTTEPRAVTVTTTNASTAMTGAANTFQAGDLGRTITATGISAGATVTAVASGTAATLSIAATATGSRAATLGAAAGTSLGFIGWAPESEAESTAYTVASVNASVVPADRITGPNQGRVDHLRSR